MHFIAERHVNGLIGNMYWIGYESHPQLFFQSFSSTSRSDTQCLLYESWL